MTRHIVEGWIALAALAASAAFVPAPAMAAPSFDCAKASTAAEKLICSSTDDPGVDTGSGMPSGSLEDRDNNLARIYRKVLAGSSAGRSAIVAAQSKWIADRDAACMSPTQSRSSEVQCLAQKYDERINALLPLQPGAQESLALCNGMLDRYRAIGAADPAGAQKSAGLLETLARNSSGGIHVAETLTDLATRQNTDVPDVSTYVAKNFHPDARLVAALKDEDENSVQDANAAWMTKLPNADVYGISTLNGSMQCESVDMFFKAAKTGASEIDAPNDQSQCPANSFADVNGQPALLSTEFLGPPSPKTYDLTEGYSVYPWKNGWQGACNISLTYAPIMSYVGRAGGPPPEAGEKAESCDGDKNCVDQREAALAVMERYQQDPQHSPRQMVDALPEEQKTAFLALKAASDAQAKVPGDADDDDDANVQSLPTDLTAEEAIPLESDPVALPLVLGGKMVLLLAGHQMTSGSRDLPDYTIWLKQMKSGKAEFMTSFTISLSFGKLLKADVSLR